MPNLLHPRQYQRADQELRLRFKRGWQPQQQPVSTDANLSLKAGGNLALEATGNLSLKANANLTAEAGAQAGLKGTAGTKVESPAMVEVKGAVINLN